MLTSLRITGFRNFSSLTMEGLTRVNLLVGENNAGKTSVLEALEILLLAPSQALILARSPMRRGENVIRAQSDSSGNSSKETDLQHLFHGRETHPGSAFELQGQTARERLSVKCVVEPPGVNPDPEGDEIVPTNIVVTSGSKTGHVPLEFPPELTKLLKRRMVLQAESKKGSSVQFIETSSPREQSIAALWDGIVLNPEEKNVVEALQIIEPEVERIASLSHSAGGSDGVFVKLQHSDRRVPLGSMGEGIKRLLVLALNLATSEGGYLLIDEVDTGLHYSVMVKMWNLVVETARRLNIQVFATSHSLDCIQALAALYEREPAVRDDISLHRIEKGAKASIRYSADEILSAAQRQVEVR